MRLTSLLIFLFLSCGLMAQQRASTVVDAVHLKDGKTLEGTILEYNYERDVVLVTEDGSIRQVEWEDIKRVNFRIEKIRATAPSALEK
ncbi:MAG: hypothetical protein AAGA62_11785, partial [Bacteroidota bacterium]